ncbi:Isoleucine--tRNA ligase [bioreactor metagenome]|uniref:Isoleucine--tRNA ligase n=1 Tax=bioreactor metagenome TaxID=1076179 RepID=A0A645EHT5_9ZZZZ
MILALRRKVNIKVRQPLAKILLPVLDNRIKEQFELVKPLVLSEVNVKEVEYIMDTIGLVTKRIKPNFKVLGKRYGKQMKEISAAFASFTQEQIAEIESSELYKLELPGGVVEITAQDVEITSEDMPGWLVASEGKLTVAMDITITPELRREGTARELVNRIQNMRKDTGLEVTDKISITIESKPEIEDSLTGFREYVCSQTLARELITVPGFTGGLSIEWDDETLNIEIKKV